MPHHAPGRTDLTSKHARRVGVPACARGLCGLVVALASGCAGRPGTNPALAVSQGDAAAALADMQQHPTALARPLVVLAGYRAWHLSIADTAAKLARATSGEPGDVLAISYMFHSDIDEIAALVVRRVEERWPSDDPLRTREVDVVGVSMGGIVARWAALPSGERTRDDRATAAYKQLRVARLFTLGTPHQGARVAGVLQPDAAARDMAAGSALLARLDEHFEAAPYELVCYARCNDRIVGATRTAPAGAVPIWHDRVWAFSHLTIGHDVLFLADIARRLRAEAPLASTAGPPRRD